MKILQVTPAFYPATYWGGPIFSLYGLCNALALTPGVELKVLTTNSAGPLRFQRIEVSAFPVRYPDKYDVFFTRRMAGKEIAPGLVVRLPSMVGWADVVHLTGTYSFPTIPTLLACRLLKKPVVWSPRGALQATHEWRGASKLALKRMWEHVCGAVMPQRCVLHVTSEAEKTASLARLPSAEVEIIANGVNVPEELPTRDWLPGGAIRLLYIGRLDPRKCIEKLLHALKQLDNVPATLNIYGTGDPRYRASLVHLARALGLDGQVRFRGHVEGKAKLNAFLEADVCVVPSDTENFGMVVAEALAHGVPVIASRGTPWAKVQTIDCGRWVRNTSSELAGAIMRIREDDLQAMGRRGRLWMKEAFSWHTVAKRMKDLYRGVM